VFPILDKTADDSIFPNMYLSFIGEGFLPGDLAAAPQAEPVRFWLNFRALVSCLAPAVPDCGVFEVVADKQFTDSFFYLVDRAILVFT